MARYVPEAGDIVWLNLTPQDCGAYRLISPASATFGKRRTFGVFFRACQRSYCTCIFSQNSGDVPNAAESRSDIPAVIPACPFEDARQRRPPYAQACRRFLDGHAAQVALQYFSGMCGVDNHS